MSRMTYTQPCATHRRHGDHPGGSLGSLETTVWEDMHHQVAMVNPRSTREWYGVRGASAGSAGACLMVVIMRRAELSV